MRVQADRCANDGALPGLSGGGLKIIAATVEATVVERIVANQGLVPLTAEVPSSELK